MGKKRNFWKKFDDFLKKNDKEVVDPLFAFLAAMGTSVNAYAFNLQSKPQNTDKSLFNVISGARTIPKGEFRLFGEANYQVAPLVQKDSRLGQQTLVEGLMGLETSVIYGITDKIQIGLLIPGQMPFGVIGSYNQISPALGDILIEPKVHLTKNVAVIPLYYVPTGNPEAGAGSNSGAYGLKVAGEFGNIQDKGVMAVQVGAIFAPDTKFQELDQSMRYHFGVGGGLEVSEGINWMAEIYGEKTDSNFPVEALTFVELKRNSWSLRVGGGSGDLAGGGSNVARAFMGFSWDLGKIGTGSTSTKKNPSSGGFFVPQVETTPQIKKEENKNQVKEVENKGEVEGLEESQGPDVLTPEQEPKSENPEKKDIEFDLNIFNNSSSTHEYFKDKEKLSVVPKTIVNQISECYPYSNPKDLVGNIDALTTIMKDRLDCSSGYDLAKGNFKKQKVSYLVYERKPASVYKKDLSLEDDNLILNTKKTLKSTKEIIKKIEERLLKSENQEFSYENNKALWIKNKVDKTFLKLKHAHRVLDYDLNKYQKALKRNDEETLNKQIIELRWGLRVINKRISYIKYLDESFQSISGKNLMAENHLLLPRTKKEIQDYKTARAIVFEFEEKGKFLDKLDSLRATQLVVDKKRKQLDQEILVIKENIKKKNEQKQKKSNLVRKAKKQLEKKDIDKAIVDKKLAEKVLKQEQEKLKIANKLKKKLELIKTHSEKVKKRKNTIENNIENLWQELAEIDRVSEEKLKKEKEIVLQRKKAEEQARLALEAEKKRQQSKLELEAKRAKEKKEREEKKALEAKLAREKEETLALAKEQEKKRLALEEEEKRIQEEERKLKEKIALEAKKAQEEEEKAALKARIKKEKLKKMELREAEILKEASIFAKKEKELLEKKRLAEKLELEKKRVQAKKAEELKLKKQLEEKIAKEKARQEKIKLMELKESKILDEAKAHYEKEKKESLDKEKKAKALARQKKERIKEMNIQEAKILKEAKLAREKEEAEKIKAELTAKKDQERKEKLALEKKRVEKEKARLALEAKKAQEAKERLALKEAKRLEAERQKVLALEAEKKRIELEKKKAQERKEREEKLAQEKKLQQEKKLKEMELREKEILEEAKKFALKEKEMIEKQKKAEEQKKLLSKVKEEKAAKSEEKESLVSTSQESLNKEYEINEMNNGDEYIDVEVKRVQAVESKGEMIEKPKKVKYFEGEITELPDKGEIFISKKKLKEMEETKKEESTEKVLTKEEVVEKPVKELPQSTEEIMTIEEVEKAIEAKKEKKVVIEDMKKIEEEKKKLVEKELKLLKKEVKKVEDEKQAQEEAKKAELKKTEQPSEVVKEKDPEFKEIEIKKVEKIKAEDSKLIPIKDRDSISITLPQPKDMPRLEPKIPTKSEKFKGLEDEDGMEYIEGPSFDSIEE